MNTPPNKDYARLRTLRDTIANAPNFNYSNFTSSTAPIPEFAELLNGCGTCGCVAGFSVALFGCKTKLRMMDCDGEAKSLLGLSKRESEFMFYGDADFGFKYFDVFKVNEHSEEAKAEALRRLNYLIGLEAREGATS